MAITYNNKPKDLYFTMREMLKGNRFDGIAGAFANNIRENSNRMAH